MSAEIVDTAGRPMSLALQRALDAPTTAERARLRQAVADAQVGNPKLARVLQAIALEWRLVDLREQATLSEMESALAGPLPPSPPEWERVGEIVTVDDTGNAIVSRGEIDRHETFESSNPDAD